MDNPHFAYIFSAYAIAAVVLAGMVVAIVLEHRRLRRELARLGDERSQP